MVQDWPRDSFPRQQAFPTQYYPAEAAAAAAARHQSYQSDRYISDLVRGHGSYPQERCGLDPTPEHARFQDGPDLRRQPPMQIDEALRMHCGIAAKQYFVAAIMEDGSPMTFLSPSPSPSPGLSPALSLGHSLSSGGQRLSDNVIRQFFDAGRYRQVMSRIDAGADPMLEDAFGLDDGMQGRPSPFARSRVLDRRRSSAFLGEWGASPARQGRKRPRGRPIIDEDEAPMTISSRRPIRIGDAEAIWNFYEQRFKNCQQTACKLIAKAWVKAVEPKKQSTHPYTGSDEKAPDWWPKAWGPTKDDKVRHKEPDHLYKRERVHLLAHILRLVVEPNGKQHNDIQKIGLNVKKLEETTVEALSSFFMDNDANAKKRPYLNEIFKVARFEERYKNGEIDGTTEVYVMAEDKLPEPESYTSENEEAGVCRDDEDHGGPRSKPAPAQALQHTATIENGPAPTLRGNAYLGDISVRNTHFAQPMMADMAAQQHSFVENGGISVHAAQPVTSAGASSISLELVASPHDNTGRRPSVYSEYASPGTSLYPPQWPTPATGASAPPPMYQYAAQQATPQPASFVSQPVPMSSSQTFMSAPFEGSARSEYDPSANAMFRANELPQAPVSQQQGYGYTLPDDGQAMRALTQVVDSVHRAPMQ